jgi:hypothetical protein
MSANNAKNTINAKGTKNTLSTKSTTIRINQETKEILENLDFVKKDTFDSIIAKLIDFYQKNKKSVVRK